MNMIFKKDLCQEIIEKWRSLTQRIIDLANEERNANINHVFSLYGEDRSMKIFIKFNSI